MMRAAIALGNPLRGDDDIANRVLCRLRGSGVAVLEGPPENLIGPLRKLAPERLFIIDALDFGGEPGEVRAFDLAETETPRPSTHSLPAGLLARFLPRTRIVVVGIQPAELGYAEGLSGSLEKRLGVIVAAVRRVILAGNPCPGSRARRRCRPLSPSLGRRPRRARSRGSR